tara:strand:+ start:2176 stop:3732 length:1557 start_codon:yes stop_codon:yes gene_type:complete
MNNNYGVLHQPFSSQYGPSQAILSPMEQKRLADEEIAKRRAAEAERQGKFIPMTQRQFGSAHEAGRTTTASGKQVGGIIGDTAVASYDGAVGGYKGLYDLTAPVVEGVENFGRGMLGMDENTEEGFRYANQPQQQAPQQAPQQPPQNDPNQGILGSELSRVNFNDTYQSDAPDIDMGGKGVLRPEETHTMPDGTVMPGINHEAYEQNNASPVEAAVEEVVEQSVDPVTTIAETPVTQRAKTLQNISQAATIDRSGTATGNKRDQTRMNIPRIGMQEKLMRIGGAITGASTQGLSAAMAAGAGAYGGLKDEERRLQQVDTQNEMAMLSKLRTMSKPTAAQEKQEGENRQTFINTQSMSQRQSFLAKRLAQEGDNVTGLKDGTYGKAKDNMLGNPRAELRLSLEQEAVNATLVSVALTKGAISNREMELFMKPIPKIAMNQEATWIAWLEMQSALNAIKAKRYDPSNVNSDGSLKSPVQADAEASAELEQLYQNLLDSGYEKGGGQGQSVPEDDDELFNI